MSLRISVRVLCVVLGISSFGADKVSYQNDILPILSENCFACHGPDGGEYGQLWRGGVRLDKKEDALRNIFLTKRETRNRKLAAKKEPLLTLSLIHI